MIRLEWGPRQATFALRKLSDRGNIFGGIINNYLGTYLDEFEFISTRGSPNKVRWFSRHWLYSSG
jgi:hypothetical protein